jgi:hypothetical protein
MSYNLCVGVEVEAATLRVRNAEIRLVHPTLTPDPPEMLGRPTCISSHTPPRSSLARSASSPIRHPTPLPCTPPRMTCAAKNRVTPTHLHISSLYAAHPARSQIGTVNQPFRSYRGLLESRSEILRLLSGSPSLDTSLEPRMPIMMTHWQPAIHPALSHLARFHAC